MVLLLKHPIGLYWRLFHGLFSNWFLFTFSSNNSWFKLLNCWWSNKRSPRASLFLYIARSFAWIRWNHLALSPCRIISHSVWCLSIIHRIPHSSFLWRRRLLLGGKWIWFVRLVHVEVWNVSRLHHSQWIVRSLGLSLFLRSTSTCSFLRFRPHSLPHTWLNASIDIVRVIGIKLAVSNLSLILAECALMLLSGLSIVKDSIWSQGIVHWLFLARLLSCSPFSIGVWR